MAIYGWKLIAQSVLFDRGFDEWQLFIYHDSSSSYTAKTIDLFEHNSLPDFKLRRGNPSAESKLNFINVTQIDFSIVDESKWLYTLMKGKEDNLFKGVLKKNGSIEFVGYLVLMTTSININETDPIIRLKLYDGLTFLKKFKDINSLPSGITKVSEILRTILNKLDFQIDINVIIDTGFPSRDYGTTYTGFYWVGTKSKYYEDSNYYEILEKICKQLLLRLVQEGGKWKFYQLTIPDVTDAARYNIVYSSGITSTINKDNLIKSIASTDLENNPEATFQRSINKFSFSVPISQVKTSSFVKQIEDIEWINGSFEDGLNGWSLISGSAVVNDNSVTLAPGSWIEQQTGDIFDVGEKLKLKISSNVTRYQSVYADAPTPSYSVVNSDSCKLASIYFITTLGDIYSLQRDVDGSGNLTGSHSWVSRASVSPYEWSNFITPLPTRIIDSVYKADYVSALMDIEIEFDTTGLDTGQIIIYLLGGHNFKKSATTYPMQYGAQHNHCILSRATEVVETASPPDSFICSAKIDNINEASINIPFHDLEGYLEESFYDTDDSSRALTWTIEGADVYTRSNIGSLLPYLAAELLKFLYGSQEVIDGRFIPGANAKYTHILQGNLTGTSKKYLPIFEESELINDRKRFVFVQHEKAAISPTVTKEYRYK